MQHETWVRQQVAQILECDLEHLDSSANLIELGVHSLLMMRLLERFNRQMRAPLGYAQLADNPTLEAWSRLLELESTTVAS